MLTKWHFFEWYYSLLTSNDPKVVVAVIGLTVAAITFILNFVVKPLLGLWKERKGKLLIEAFHTSSPGGLVYNSIDLELVITNKSNTTIHINEPIFKIRRTMVIFDVKKRSFPLPLQPGQQIKLPLHLDIVFISQYLSLGKSFRYMIIDTLKKKHFSKIYNKNVVSGIKYKKFNFWE